MLQKSLIPKSLLSRFAKSLAFLAFFSFTVVLNAQEDAAAGKNLFKSNCASCHNKNMKDKSTGPALGGVQDRWADEPEMLYTWIRNSVALAESGTSPRAEEMINYDPSAMTNFPQLTNTDIDNILLYVNKMYEEGCFPCIVSTTTGSPEVVETDNTLLYVLLVGLLAALSLILARVNTSLSHIAELKSTGVEPERKSLIQILTSGPVLSFIVFMLLVIGAYNTVDKAIALGRQQNYQPEMPIKFSHKTHAGLHQIDCQYCHDGARRSKHSVIPASNTCMNCHKAIKKGSTYGTAEISKIFAAHGFNPNNNTYIENYDDMSEEDIEKIFKKWIMSEYINDNAGKEDRAEAEADKQWNAIKTSLTAGKENGKIQGPIEWTRIHNLPDHVYFNHAQHVTVGEVECQTCHGEIQEMEEVYQSSPLSMGWCINCHRETEVKFKGNEYYESYQNYVQEMEDGERSKVTVEDIGGLECQKCHY